ncbi:MAG: nucleoside hydrolase [Prolixibacteraceae bacterium]|jgi:inosine-uridine nucleoside N-ribohydrolase|nr:nucleoside hydrolase [Prolixibacteraceae bacterium]
MKKIVLNLFLLVIISGLSFNAFAQKQKVIFDCDLGGDIDDAYALSLLIASPELEILGVVMDFGNTPKRAQIACRMLYETGLENIPVVIGRKTEDTYYNQFYWGEGFDKIKPVKQGAADFIIEQLKKYPNEVILITVGPVPNMSDILDKEPGALKLAKHVYSMFGSFYMGRNSSPIPANEYNVAQDISAAKKFASSGAKITYAGLDITCYVSLKLELIELLSQRKSPLTDAVVGLYSLWHIGANAKPEPVLYDAVAVAMVIWPELFKTRKAFVKVTDDGYTVIDESKEPNCEIGVTINTNEFLNKYMDRLMKQNLMRK